MNFLEKINNLNIILVALASIVTISSFVFDFSFEEILFYISKFDILHEDIISFIFGVVVGIVGGTVIGGTVGVLIGIVVGIVGGILSSVVGGIVGILIGIVVGGGDRIENFIKDNYKKIISLTIILLFISLYFIVDRKLNFTNRLFNYKYKNYLLKNIDINDEKNLKILNKILKLTDIDSNKKEDLQIFIRVFSILADFYSNSNNKFMIQNNYEQHMKMIEYPIIESTLEYLKKSSEIIIKLINSKVEDKINPPYFFLDESLTIDKEIVFKNQKAIIEFDNKNFQKAKEIFEECLNSFKEADKFGVTLINKEAFKSEVDFSNFAKLNINLANTLFELNEFQKTIENLNLALKSTYSFFYINNPYIYYIYDRKLNAEIKLRLDTTETIKKIEEFINATEKGIVEKEKIKNLTNRDKNISENGKVDSFDKSKWSLFDYQLNFANILYEEKDYKNALFFYNSALQTIPKKNHYFLIYIYHKMGLTYEKLNKIDNAMRSFELAKSYSLELGEKYPFPDESLNIPYSEK